MLRSAGRAVDALDRAVRRIPRLVQRRDINSAYFRRRGEEHLLAPAALLCADIELYHLSVEFLALAYEEEVDKIAERLGVTAAGAAGDDQRREPRAL